MIQIAPIDSRLLVAHSATVSKKPHKVEEAATTYTAKQPVKAAPAPRADEARQIRYIDPERARRLTKEILDKHHDLFRRLAQ